jgi:hypothetical protein
MVLAEAAGTACAAAAAGASAAGAGGALLRLHAVAIEQVWTRSVERMAPRVTRRARFEKGRRAGTLRFR